MSKKSSLSAAAAFDSSRRKFLGNCCAGVGMTGMLSALSSLRLMGGAASPNNGPVTPKTAGAVASDYKALVCVFLGGGNDANNLIIPTGSGYAGYASARSNLAIPRATKASLINTFCYINICLILVIK